MGKVNEKSCFICGVPSKYCCPSCSIRTCSLACVKAHKSREKCSGVRDKTAFVDVNDFTNSNLLSDYRFLEDAARAVDNAGRSLPFRRFSRFLPVPLYKLRVACNARKTSIQFLPQVFSKRKMNTTYLNYKDQVIFWKIEWHFPQIDHTYVDDRLDERKSINTCLDKYLCAHSSLEFKKELEYFQSLGHKGVCVLMEKTKCPANDIRYYELQKKKSLMKNFAGKWIIESPTLIVIGEVHLSYFPLITDDGDDSCSVEVSNVEPQPSEKVSL